MTHPVRQFAFAACLLFSISAQADPRGEQSFETCSMVTSEYITVLQLINRGFSGEQLTRNLPGLDRQGAKRVRLLEAAAREDGLVDTFSAVNAEFARCSQRVYQRGGKPKPDSREGHFYFCAGENKLRYEILVAATLDADINDVLAQVPTGRHRIARAIFRLQANKGTLAAFDAIGDELKYCLNGTS
ncbi:hypothetical protein EZI54_01740 [Marinobacter halodurans]|uniref:Uncharacterized protein n=1 Tax=Marinobacter halodurans TaxID=2528979 RepID=A0ABY1ZQG9_9GAMM|nr:hypothetical protein [Marinobacter halodurans]TBW59060.1 hypothetical protein EZI54_01740 [Marinobacter halodurans]